MRRFVLAAAVLTTIVGLALLTVPLPVARTLSVPPPLVDPHEPTMGSLIGGEVITLTGEYLTSVTGVHFGTEEAEFTATNSELRVTVPPADHYAAGTVEVRLGSALGAVPFELAHGYDVRTAVDRQMAYAFRHWNDYNLPEYGDFNAWGGDCMNFVSQTLVARGWAQGEEWFNDAQRDWDSAFVYVPDFDAWMSAHPESGARRLGMDDIDELKIGDVAMIDWDGNGFFNHAQVISGFEVVDGERRVLMVGHNLDSTYRDLERAMAAEGGQGVAVFWSIPSA